MVPIRRALSHFGWQIRSRGRADCGLCRGTSKGTVSFTERLWHCHRCHAGGDVFELVCSVSKCDFREALRYVAEVAGVNLAMSRRPEVQRQIAENHRQQARIGSAADILAEMERALRLDCRERIQLVEHHLDALSAARTWSERDWLIAAGCYDILQSNLAAYTVLAFGAIADRSRYILQPECRREIEAAIRLAGGLRDENGRWVEVLE
jgi:hypothetical protein